MCKETIWNVYYGSSEYARVMGDPVLGTVSARSRDTAIAKAERGEWLTRGQSSLAGYWAAPAPKATTNAITE